MPISQPVFVHDRYTRARYKRTSVEQIEVGLFLAALICFFCAPAFAGRRHQSRPGGIDFGNVNVGFNSTQTVVVANFGRSEATISTAAVTGAGFNYVGPALPLRLPRGHSVNLSFNFAPSAAGVSAGTVSLSTSSGDISPETISLTGTGVQLQEALSLTLSPPSVSFGSVQVGTSATRTVSLLNSGTGPVNISQATTMGSAFALSGLPMPMTLSPGQASSFTVSFLPAGTGSASGSVSVMSNAANSVSTVALSGVGVEPQISVAPASVSFGTVTVGQTRPQTVTLSNPGGANLNITQVVGPGTGFSLSGLALPLTLAPGTSARFTVSFTPPSGADSASGLTLVSNAPSSPTTIALSGSGLASVLQLTPSTTSLSFGSETLNASSTQSVTITNTGNAAVRTSNITVSGAGFSLTGLSAGLALSPGQAATANVTFAPAAAGSVTGSVVVTSNATNSPATITLSGTGVQPSAQLTPPPQAAGYSLAFADDLNTLDISPNMLGNYTWYQGLWWQQTVAPLSEFSVSNSILTLNWQNGLGDANLCTTAKDASHYQAWRYGYFEARMAWGNTTTGAWPAFWLIPVEDITGADVISGVRDSGEIDVMEGQGGSNPNTVYGTLHEWKNNADIYNNNSSNAYNVPSGVDLSQYHTYGVLWTPGTISWYFDNQLTHSANTTAIFDEQTFYIVLSSQEGVNWSGGNLSGITADTIPLNVDWVHVWQKP